MLDGGIFTARFENTHPLGSVVEFRNTTTDSTWELGVTGNQPPAGIPQGAMYFYHQGAPDVAMTIAASSWIGLGLPNP